MPVIEPVDPFQDGELHRLRGFAKGGRGRGSFLAEPNLAENASAKFPPEYNRDKFELTAWALSGRLSQLELIDPGGLLDRQMNSLIDYAHYNNGGA